MAQLDFYANSSDIIHVIDYMFELSPMRLFEAYSRVDHEIREFKSGKDVLESSHIEDNHGGIFVRGWWDSVTSSPYVKRFDLNPTVGRFRESLEGVGTFQLLQGRPHDLADNALNLSCFTHWNEKGAFQRANCSDSEISEVNWAELKCLSGKLHRQIINTFSKAKLFKRPILEGAYSDLKNGGKLFGQPGVYLIGSEEIES
ncbi:hypothetical protein ORJ66_19935 [Pseudoalteromonas tunicata]|uniref:hypothetical protein n=1 Tax=Pseudoalteromonas tunicata TaxID=314281 RepID=UPI00273EDABC|nr:hypothetical protein [Pseudoalteromonas tunicata]MDP5215325.1 hypothetical protein [Pseudoalteromonas tunicata]